MSVRGLGELEAKVMGLLWDAPQPMTVREVLDSLPGPQRYAYTTVLTVLDNLYRKGWVSREARGRAHAFSPVEDRAAYAARLMAELLAGGGDTPEVLLNFVGRLDSETLSALRRAVSRSSRAGPERRG